MARYDVSARLDAHHLLHARVHARTPAAALAVARDEMVVGGLDPATPYYATVRRRGVRRRTETFVSLGPDGPEPTGVREPRRPAPPPPTLRRALDDPA